MVAGDRAGAWDKFGINLPAREPPRGLAKQLANHLEVLARLAVEEGELHTHMATLGGRVDYLLAQS